MMNKIYFLSVVLILIYACNSTRKVSNNDSIETKEQFQEFEGQIIYELDIEDKTGEMTKEEGKMFMGDEQIYLVKGNRYKTEMNGMLKITQIYLGGDTLFTQMGDVASLFWTDVSTNPDKLIDYNIKKDVETIAGVRCDLLTINSEEGITKYYFNEKYYADPNNFLNHDYEFWKFCIEKMKAIPLKIVSDDKDMYFESTAIEIKEMKVSDTEFKLPNLPKVKAPF